MAGVTYLDGIEIFYIMNIFNTMKYSYLWLFLNQI